MLSPLSPLIIQWILTIPSKEIIENDRKMVGSDPVQLEVDEKVD